MGAVPRPGPYNYVLKSSALLVEGVQRPDSCVPKNNWAERIAHVSLDLDLMVVLPIKVTVGWQLCYP